MSKNDVWTSRDRHYCKIQGTYVGDPSSHPHDAFRLLPDVPVGDKNNVQYRQFGTAAPEVVASVLRSTLFKVIQNDSSYMQSSSLDSNSITSPLV
eukprot:1196083-Prorocentrum_minimum.AAC.5